MSEYKFETLQVHAGQEQADPATDSRAVPIYQTTSYVFHNCAHAAARFGLQDAGNIYGRLTNSTVDAFEQRIAALEGGVAALGVASGAAAITYTFLNLAGARDNIVSAQTLYGGTFNLLEHTLPTYGITATFVQPTDYEAYEKAINDRTRAVYIETIGNPNANLIDIEKVAAIAHKHKIPLVVDNTFATPYLVRPFEYGADIVVHSATKYMDGHALQGGGVIVDSGNFDWTNGRFPEFTEPDESYHGVVYTKEFGRMAYIIKARMQLMRDFGAYPAAHSAFLLNLGLETLAVRMPRYCENGRRVAEYLAASDKVESVIYPGLPTDKYHALAEKYLGGQASGVVTFVIKGGKANAIRFMDSLKLACNEVHVADIRTCVLHPASETHRQLTDEQLIAAGINPGMIRFSTGLENIGDILGDIAQAMEQVSK